MARYYGSIGYVETLETSPSVYTERVAERSYYGDEIVNMRRLETGESTNDNVNVSNQFSIIADAYAYDHFFAIRYLTWMGQRWKVNKVTVQRPRLILEIGGLWNGKTPEA